MSSIAFAYKPTIVIATVSREFTDCGYSSNNIQVIRKINTGSWQTYDPTLPVSSISGYEKGAAYLFVSKLDLDLTGLAYNTLPDNYETIAGNNVLENNWFAGIARQTADLTTDVGFNATNLRIIYRVDIPYESFDPNEAASAISGIVQGQCYLGFALADMDVSEWFIPPVVIKDDITRETDEYKYFGTTDVVDGTGASVKDFYNVPVRFFADEASLPTTGIENIVYVAKAESTSWYWDGAVYQPIGGGGITTETDPTVPTLVKNIPVSADAATNKYLNWNGSAYTRKQIAYSEIASTPTIPTQYTDEMAQDATAALLAAGTHTGITFTYDDTGNKISAAVTGGTETDPLSVHLTGTSTATGDMTLALGTTNELNITGNQANKELFVVTNSNATAGTAIKGIASGSGSGVFGQSDSGSGLNGLSSSGNGSNSISTSGTGSYGQSTSGIGVQGRSSSNYSVSAYRFNSGTNDKVGILEILRFSSGTSTNGFGGYLDWNIESSGGSAFLAARIGAYWREVNDTGRISALTETLVYKNTSVITLETVCGYVVTNNATPANLSTVEITDETCGIIEISIVAKHNLTSGMVVGKKIVSYIKDGGTLTLGTAATVLPNEITGALIGSSYTISAVSNQLSIDVTGVAATNITWKATIKIIPNS